MNEIDLIQLIEDNLHNENMEWKGKYYNRNQPFLQKKFIMPNNIIIFFIQRFTNFLKKE